MGRPLCGLRHLGHGRRGRGHTRHIHTGITELDRVLGGGVVPGSVMLLAGDPGVGKSTLLLEVAHRWAEAGKRSLYLSGEESAGQIRMRAERTGCTHDELYLAAESDLQTVLGHIDEVQPSLVVVDSVQTMSTTEAEGVTGGVTQVRAVTTTLTMAGRPRHQGRRDRGATLTRAPRRRRPALRGRPPVVASPGPRRQESLRRRRRSRLFSPARQRNRVCVRPVGAVS